MNQRPRVQQYVRNQRSSSSFTSTSHDFRQPGDRRVVGRSRSQNPTISSEDPNLTHHARETPTTAERRASRQRMIEIHQGKQAMNTRDSHHSRSLEARLPYVRSHKQPTEHRASRIGITNDPHSFLECAEVNKSGCFGHTHSREMRESQRSQMFSAMQSKRRSIRRDTELPKSLLENLLAIDATEIALALQISPVLATSTPDVHLRTPGGKLVTTFQHNCLRSLASMLMCPHTVVPITVGLFNRSVTADESVYLKTLSNEITALNTVNPHPIPGDQIKFNFCASSLPLVIVLLAGYLLGLTLGWQLGLAVAVTGSMLYLIICSIIMYGVKGKRTPRWMQFAETLSRYMRGCHLLLNILFCKVPPVSNTAQPVKLLPINLDVSNCASAMNAVALMSEKLWVYIEHKYGKAAVRMQWASKDVYSDSGQTYRKCCCLPLWLWFAVYLTSSLSLATLLAVPTTQSRYNALHPSAPKTTLSKASTKSSTSELPMTNEWIQITAITCGALASVSLFVLIVVSCPPIINLIRGRPFQRASQRLRWKGDDKLCDLPLDGCYAASTGLFDPACMRVDGSRGLERFMLCPREYPFHLHTDTSPVANQWRAASGANTKFKTVTCRKSGQLNTYRSKTDIENQSEHSRNSGSVDSSAESDEMADEDEESNSEENEDNEMRTQLHNGSAFCNSGEQLIPDWKGDKASRKFKSNCPTGKNDNEVDTKVLSRWKKFIRKGLLEGCKCLSMIDARTGGRQTRVVICITGTGMPDTQPNSLGKLSTLIRLIDRLLMQLPGGGTSGDVNPLLKPKSPEPTAADSSKIKNPKCAVSNTWTPNVVVLLTAVVPAFPYTGNIGQHGLYTMNECTPELRRPSTSLLGTPMHCSGFKIWWSVHHFCHLPIYLEEETPCRQITENPNQSQAHGGRSDYAFQALTNLPTDGTLLDLFATTHELADLNRKYLRHLLTMSAFMGRMLLIDRLLAVQNYPACGPIHCMMDSGTHHTSLVTLITWLCLLKHWPFHAAWLTVFIEENIRSGTDAVGNRFHRTGSSKSRDQLEDSQSFPDERLSTGSQRATTTAPLSLDTSLSQLHSRVLKRLASAVETARQKALSASIGVNEPYMQDPGRLIQVHSPRVISTLEMCNLALRDRDPRRLAEFLHCKKSDQVPPMDHQETTGVCTKTVPSFSEAGQVTVRRLVQLIKLTPFLNPHVTAWIKDISSTKFAMNESATEERSDAARQTGMPVKPHKSAEKPTEAHSRTHLLSNSSLKIEKCPVRLKHGLPRKLLSQMSIDDVCDLLDDIIDLSVNLGNEFSTKKETSRFVTGTHSAEKPIGYSSNDSDTIINDPAPPAPTNWKSSPPERKASLKRRYVESIKRQNVNGSVLSICSLKELQKELAMSFGDWQLFSALIVYLRSCERDTTVVCGSSEMHTAQKSGDVVPFGHHSGRTGKQGQQHLVGTVSDTSLALTVRSAPLYGNSPTRGTEQNNFVARNTARSMTALHVGSGGVGEYATRDTQHHFFDTQPAPHSSFCHQHTEELWKYHQKYTKATAASMPRATEKRLLCPQHQEHGTLCHHTSRRVCPGIGYVTQATGSLELNDETDFRSPKEHTCVDSRGSKANYIIQQHPPEEDKRHRFSTVPNEPPIRMPLGQTKIHPCTLHPAGQPSTRVPYAVSDGAFCSLQRDTQPSGWRSQPDEHRTDKHEHTRNTDIVMSRDSVCPSTAFSNNSNSTSLAGEMADEVAELSFSQMSTNKILPEANGKSAEMTKEDSLNHQSDHSCDCNYWYSLEAALQKTHRHPVTNILQKTTSSDSDSSSNNENSLSDSLSTCQSRDVQSSDTGSSQTFIESSSEQVNKVY